MKDYKKSQSLSTDIIVVIVIVLFGSLFLVLNKINEESNENISDKESLAATESKILVENFKTKGIIDKENSISVEKLMQVDEAQIRSELGITGEFAIVFEKNGRLVKIDPENNINCVGSGNIVVNGVICS